MEEMDKKKYLESMDMLEKEIERMSSSKAMDRKKAIETIRARVEEGVGEMLDFNSLRYSNEGEDDNDSPSPSSSRSRPKLRVWDTVFEIGRKYFESVAHVKASVELGFKAIETIIKRANKTYPFLSSESLYKFILKNLNEESPNIQPFRYNFFQLLQNLLSVNYYTTSFKAIHWKQIILTIIKLHKKSSTTSVPPKTMILQTLNVCIIYGSNVPELIPFLRHDLVAFYRQLLLDKTNPAAVVNRGIVLLCRYNAVEFRGILCNFGEAVIESIMSHNTNAGFHRDHEEEPSIIDLLLIQLQLHAPCDVSSSSPAFYAEDKGKWEILIKDIYIFAIDLIEEIAKKSGYNKHPKNPIPENLLLLAVKSTILLHVQRADDNIPGEELSPKRAMMFKPFRAIVADATQPCESQIVWIQFISAVLYAFPDISDSSMIYQLHRIGTALLNSVFIAREEVYSFLRAILFAEKHLKQKGLIEKLNSWSHIWDIVIKSLHVNEAKPEALEFVRCLLLDIPFANINSLLLLYVENAIGASQESLHLLSEFLSRCSVPEHIRPARLSGQIEGSDKPSPRIALLRWLVNSLMDKSIPNTEVQIATILCSLMVNRSHLFIQTQYLMDNSFQITKPFEMIYEEFESTILKCCFVSPPSISQPRCHNPKKLEERGIFCINSDFAGKLFLLLQDDLQQLPPIDVLSLDFTKKLTQLQFRVSVLLNIINLLEVHKLCEETQEFRLNMEDLFDKTFHRYSNIVSEFLKNDNTSVQLHSVAKIMKRLLKNDHICKQVKFSFAAKYPLKILEFWKNTFWTALPNKRIEASPATQIARMEMASDEFQNHRYIQTAEGEVRITAKQAIEFASMESLQCLIEFANNSDKKADMFKSLVQDCLEIGENFNILMPFFINLSIELLTAMVPSFHQIGPVHESMLLLFQTVCKVYHSDMTCAIKIWELFGKLAPEMSTPEVESVDQKKYMALVGAMLRRRDAYGVDAIKVALKTMTVLAKFDPLWQWTVTRLPNEVISKPIFSAVTGFLKSSSQQVRLSAVNFFCVVFEAEAVTTDAGHLDNYSDADTIIAQALVKRKDLYEKVYTKLLEVYNVPVFSDMEMVEESVNRTAVVIMCLVQTLFAYPYNQKRVLFCLFLTIKLKSISIPLINRALKNAKKDSTRTLASHILYTLEKWLKLGYEIVDFPYQLFDFNSQDEFFKKYRREISFQLFQNPDVENARLLENFSRFISIPVADLIRECYGMIMSRLVMGIATTVDDIEKGSAGASTKQQTLDTLNASYNRLIHIFGNVLNAEENLKTCLDDVILNIISLTFQPSITTTWDCRKIKLPEPEPPFYDEAKILLGLEHLRHKIHHNEKSSVIGYLVRTSPKKLYRILLTLVIRIHKAHDWLETFWRLHHYCFFVKLLLREPRDVFELMKSYACQFIVYSYLRLLSQKQNPSPALTSFKIAVLKNLIDFVKALTALSIEEMSVHFRPIVSQVIATVTAYPETTYLGIRLLEFLMKTHGKSFTNCITSLDPFPTEIEAFSEFKDIHSEFKYGSQRNAWPLEKELQNCLVQLSSSHAFGNGTTKERLRFMKQLLSQRKFDLEGFVKVMTGKKFSDECSNDIIHSLIQMLLGVINRSRDEEVIIEACRCLGEIGPIDLGVLVLPSYDPKSKLHSASNSIHGIITSAGEYLQGEDIDLVATTSEVLQSILKTVQGSEVLTNNITKTNPRIARILIPLKSEENDKVNGNVISCNAPNLEILLSRLEYSEYISYTNWIKQLTSGIITTLQPDECLLHKLLPLCRLKATFCEEILPYVIYTALTAGKNNLVVRKVLSTYFRKFFSNFSANRKSFCQPSWYGLNDQEEERTTSIHANKLALKSLLRVVQFLRLHNLTFDIGGSVKTPWDNNFWLDLNYLDVAKTAQYCGAYLSSILYSEIYAFSDDKAESAVSGFSFDGGSMVQKLNTNPSAAVAKLLLKAFISIGESDAVYGCGSARYSDFMSNVQHLEQMNQWNRSLAAYDSSSCDQLTSRIGICNSLKELGLFNTLWTFLKGVDEMSGFVEPELTEIQYECGWRLSKWDINCDKANYVKNSRIEDLAFGTSVQKSIYESIQSALNTDRLNHKESIRSGFLSIVQDLKHASVESAENAYTFLAQFQMFRMIEDFYSTRESGVSSEQLIQNWHLLDKLGCSNLKFQESVLYLRSILLKAFNEKENSPHLITSYDECILNILTKARAAGRLELAESCTAKICSRSLLPRKKLEVAKNHWARGEQDIALSILGKLMENNGPDRNADIHATSLLLYGEWLSETKAEDPTIIMERYFHQTAILYETKKAFGTAQEISKAYITLAKYADSLYQNVSSYVKSEMFQEKIRTITKSQQELDRLKQVHNNDSNKPDSDTKKSASILLKQINLDKSEASATTTEIGKFLKCALKYYLRGLRYSSEHDLLIFRAIGLWLDNTNYIQETMKIVCEESLPSYKYVVVLHQLSARLGVNNSNGIGEALQRILIKCAQDHPYHTLPVLLAQALMNKDKEPTRGAKKEAENDRVLAAKNLVEILKKRQGPLGELTIKMEQLWSALIQFANFQDTSKLSMRKKVPDTLPLKNLRGLTVLPIPTISLEVSPSFKYEDFLVGISSFDTEYLLVGGINSPKKITCTGTNGKKYNMLLKGQDDLRQDAVMQQVFGVMNKLLQNEPKTKARRLQVRTYKVVPLSQRSGIIEWCENTQTFGNYLVGSDNLSGAHRLYRPNDITPKECRKKLNDVRDQGIHRKLDVFTDIVTKIKPVFHNFFFENFKDPGTFFERRLAYTRSVSTSSMVGYILGLGDRHVLNILIDKNSAEFIHIDLGVAFEQGRILPTPETVPFRLSRDVVDGMGFCGVEGDFRRSCEMTLDVLRNNAEIILAILEVLLYDPLYFWALSADRVQKVQPGMRSANRLSTGGEGQVEEPPIRERNNSAARVLLRLKQKLIGVEEGVSSGSTLSVPGHVALLIQRACDESRLSRLFPGWQAYL